MPKHFKNLGFRFKPVIQCKPISPTPLYVQRVGTNAYILFQRNRHRNQFRTLTLVFLVYIVEVHKGIPRVLNVFGRLRADHDTPHQGLNFRPGEKLNAGLNSPVSTLRTKQVAPFVQSCASLLQVPEKRLIYGPD